MKYKPKKVYERVYIHAGKVQAAEGCALVLHAMDAFSEFAFESVFNQPPQVTVEVLNKLFENILEGHKPIFHPRQIVFVTNLPEEYDKLFKQTQAANHRFVYNKEATTKAMKGLLSSIRYEMVEL